MALTIGTRIAAYELVSIRERLLGYQNGKPVRSSFYGKTRKSVQDQIATAVRDFENGSWQPKKNPTVGEFMKQWLDDVVKPSVRPRTHHSYRYIVDSHIVESLGARKLRTITAPMMQGLLTERP